MRTNVTIDDDHVLDQQRTCERFRTTPLPLGEPLLDDLTGTGEVLAYLDDESSRDRMAGPACRLDSCSHR